MPSSSSGTRNQSACDTHPRSYATLKPSYNSYVEPEPLRHLARCTPVPGSLRSGGLLKPLVWRLTTVTVLGEEHLKDLRRLWLSPTTPAISMRRSSDPAAQLAQHGRSLVAAIVLLVAAWGPICRSSSRPGRSHDSRGISSLIGP